MPMSFFLVRADSPYTSIAEIARSKPKIRLLTSKKGSSPAVASENMLSQYGFTFDEVANEDDTVLDKNGVTLLIDPMSFQYLVGAEIDYSEGLEGSQFVIKNPNASSTCGCGSSFSV